MNFEKRMKKHIDATLDEQVPNPYPKKRPFPIWAKIAIPAGSCALIAVIALSIALPQIQRAPEPLSFHVAAPKQTLVASAPEALVSRIGEKALLDLDPYFADESKTNYVLSPASYALAVSAVAAVSDGFDLDAFGFVDPAEDTKALLKAWNFRRDGSSQSQGNYCQFDSGVLHQQVGEKYRFDETKKAEIAEKYIATDVALLENYHARATEYFHENVGLTIPIPDPDLDDDGVITYGAIKMKDYVSPGFGERDEPFYINKEKISVPSRNFGTYYMPAHLYYYQGPNYQAFNLGINKTSLVFIVPDKDVALEAVHPGEAYVSYLANRQPQYAIGYVPYFHLRTEIENITGALSSKLTGDEIPFAKLLAEDVVNDLVLSSVLQTSDFEFNRHGVSGESITVITYSGASAAETLEVEPIILNVDRPFYAISVKDGFPLFVNKVNDPLN